MDEFNLLTKKILNIIAAGEGEIITIQGFTDARKTAPLKTNLAAASLKKMKISALGIGDYAGDNISQPFSMAKKVEAEFKIILCSPQNGSECWSLFERIAGKLAFSQEIITTELECSEMSYNKDWGAMTLAVTLHCLFGFTDNRIPSYANVNDLKIIAKNN